MSRAAIRAAFGARSAVRAGPYDMTKEAPPSAPLLANRFVVALGMAALAAPFVISGTMKLLDLTGAVAEVRALTGADQTLAPMLAALVIGTQLAGSGLLLSGLRRAVTAGAAILAGFTIVATLVAHAWWTREGPDRARDLAVFFEHVAICGGLALAVAVVWRR